MATPSEKLAASFQILHEIQEEQKIAAIKTTEIKELIENVLLKMDF